LSHTSRRARFWKRSPAVTQNVVVLAVAWTLLIVALGLLAAHHEMQDQREIVRAEARAHFLKDQAFRFWASAHGGVYVPPSEKTPPSPYLSHLPDRDVETTAGKKLTLMNPAYMVRQLTENFAELYAISGRITSLKPLRPENRPDPWEQAALESFERGETEANEFTEIDGELHLRLMRPMIAEKSCLKCHGHQDYKAGDIRGGVGVSIPAGPFFARAHEKILNNSLALTLLWLVGLGGIVFGGVLIRRRMREGERAEAERQRHQVFMQTVIDGIPESLMVINRDYTIELANKTACEIAGGRDPAAANLRCHQISHASATPCEGDEHPCPLKRVFATGELVTVEHEHLDAEGRPVPIEIIAAPIVNKKGEVIQVIESGRDITMRRRGEEAREMHLRFLENMTRVDRTIQQSTDVEQMMSDVLQVVLEMFKVDRAWLLYPCDPDAESWRVPMERTRPEFPGALALGEDIPMMPEVVDVFREALDRDDVITVDYRNPGTAQKTAERFSTQAEMHIAIHPPTGKPWIFGVHQCSHYRDWTDEEKNLFRRIGRRIGDGLGSLLALRDLRLSEERWRSLTMNAPGHIMLLDCEGTILFINRTVSDLSTEQMLGTSVLDCIPEDFRETVSECLKQVVESRRFGTYETDYHTGKGDILRFEARVSPVLDQGRTTALIVSSHDITARKRNEEEKLSMERQLQHTQKLESLGVLAGGIAHDFNNLLMVILGNADLALHELSPMSPARGNIQEIERSSKRAAELAKQMLAYSGKGRFVVEPIDVGELSGEMTHLLEVSISKKVLLRYNLAENLPTFDGDVTQIRQIIMNLITNASEAIGDRSGVIALSTGAMDCDRAYLRSVDEVLRASLDEPLSEGVYVFIEVADTGCGMSRETIGKIFDPFFTTKFTGRGLGMSAVLGIVRGHRGAIKIYSEEGKGTTFKILFPANKPDDIDVTLEKKAGTEKNNWRGGGTILIADDEETICAVGRQMLELMGFSVLTAADGRVAMKVFREHADEIVCVLLDLTMPHMDGEEAFREMRRLHPGVTVVLCSGYNEQDATQRFAGKGLAGFIQKPFDMATLRTKLMEVLRDAPGAKETDEPGL
jgi:PAS domain S-box-containing protein